MLVSLCRHYARIYVQATEFSCSLVYDDRNSQRETNAARREETRRGSHANDNRTSCFPLSSPDIWVDCVKCVTAKRQSVVMFSGTCKPGLLFFLRASGDAVFFVSVFIFRCARATRRNAFPQHCSRHGNVCCNRWFFSGRGNSDSFVSHLH